MDFLARLRPYRLALWIVAAVGFFGLNGVFLYDAVLEPALVTDALQNPVSAVFVIEAFLMMLLLAGLVWVSGLEKPGWVAFIVLSILGSLAFSVPAFLLWHLRKQYDRKESVPSSRPRP